MNRIVSAWKWRTNEDIFVSSWILCTNTLLKAWRIPGQCLWNRKYGRRLAQTYDPEWSFRAAMASWWLQKLPNLGRVSFAKKPNFLIQTGMGWVYGENPVFRLKIKRNLKSFLLPREYSCLLPTPFFLAC